VADQPTPKPASGKFSQDFFYKTASGLDAHTQVNQDSFEEFQSAVGEVLTWLETQEVQPRTFGAKPQSNNVSTFPYPTNGSLPGCEDCGAEITGFTVNGKNYTPQQAVESRVKRYGKPICSQCTRKPEYAAMKNSGFQRRG
jgi:hypothetical protein